MSYHDPVLLEKSIEELQIIPDGIYVDCTFGGGGHARKILDQLSEKGKLYAFDQDMDAQQNKIEDPRLILIPQNFRFLKNYLKFYKVESVNGILADFGVSSHQFNEAERGFSTRFKGPLDMRMNQNQTLSAKEIVNTYEEEKLADLFFNYGELRESHKIAQIIVDARENNPINTTEELGNLFNYIPDRNRNKFLAQLFQALRIEVNDELDALKDLLLQSYEMLGENGILVAISYHSLEDRLVKRYLKTGLFEGEPERDVFGNWFKPWNLPTSKAIVPSFEEIKRNPRARSAKMRVGIKNNG